MDPINPWLDPIEVRRMADRLLRPVSDSTVTVADAGFDEEFVGYATERTAVPAIVAGPARVAVPPVESAENEAPPATESTPRLAAEPMESSARGPFLDRR